MMETKYSNPITIERMSRKLIKERSAKVKECLKEFYKENAREIETLLGSIANYSLVYGGNEQTDRIKTTLWRLIPYEGNFKVEVNEETNLVAKKILIDKLVKIKDSKIQKEYINEYTRLLGFKKGIIINEIKRKQL